MKNRNLTELRDHSVRIGLNPDLVQASGGNVSWKDGSNIWIKASGKRLIDATSEDIFCELNYEDLDSNELRCTSDFSNYVRGSLTPSIETNFHLLLSRPFVTHLHSIGSISFGLIQSGELRVQDFGLEIEYQRIPYAKPGLELVQAILETKNYDSSILVLENHGIIFSGENLSQIESLIEKYEDFFISCIANLPVKDSLPDWIQILVNGVLTPDEAVFLGKTPFVQSEISMQDSVSINLLGELIFPKHFSVDRINLAQFYVRVAKLIERKTLVRYLSTSEIDALLSWDKEKLRIRMAK